HNDSSRPDSAVSCSNVMSLPATRRTPDLLLMVPRNASMGTPFGDAPTRFGAVQDALHAQIDAHRTSIAFGLQQYPATDGSCGQQACCAEDPVPPSPRSADAVTSALYTCDPLSCVASSVARPIGDG